MGLKPNTGVQAVPDEPWRSFLQALDGRLHRALPKLERNSDRDRDDVVRLARAGHIHAGELKARYFTEVRPYWLSKEGWHDKSLRT